MKSKEGGLPTMTVVGLIIILFMIGVLAPVTYIYTSGITRGGDEKSCKINSLGRDLDSSVNDICELKVLELFADKESKCKSSGPFEFNTCAAEQLANLAARCWDMRGEGKLDVGDFTCFEVCLRSGDVKCSGLGCFLDRVSFIPPYTIPQSTMDGVLASADLSKGIQGSIKYSDYLPEGTVEIVSTISSGRYVKVKYADDGPDKILIETAMRGGSARLC